MGPQQKGGATRKVAARVMELKETLERYNYRYPRAR